MAQITSPSNNCSAIDQQDENNPIFNLTLSCNASSSSSTSYHHQEDVTSTPINKAKLLMENQPPKPVVTQITSEIDQRDENNRLFKLNLSCNASSSSSSSSSSISHVSKKKRSLYEEDVITFNPIKKAKLSKKNGREERWLRLTMAPPDIFSIKKTLEESDINNLARLMLSKAAVEEDLLVYFDEDMKRRLKNKEGLVVRVWDKDCDVIFNMKMKMWGSNGSVVLNDRWITKFVNRRGLKRGDQIGLYWDGSNGRLVFSLLRKALNINVTPL